MTGWAGGIANREWQRDRRSPDSGRIGLTGDVHRILEKWRAEHDWQPGTVWDSRTATYVNEMELTTHE